MGDDITIANRLAGLDGTTVWHEFTDLANEHKAVNLGQGFPDWDAPEFAIEACGKATSEGHNQYARPGGSPELVKVLADYYSPLLGHTINPMTQVCVTVGCSEALFLACIPF